MGLRVQYRERLLKVQYLSTDQSIQALFDDVARAHGFELLDYNSLEDSIRALESAKSELIVIDTSYPEAVYKKLLYTISTIKRNVAVIMIGPHAKDYELLKTSSNVTYIAMLNTPVKACDISQALDKFHNAHNAALKEDLSNAFQQHQFQLYYQPIIDLSDNTLVGAESLIRWNRPGHGIVEPGSFLPYIEEFGLLGDMTNETFDICFQQQAAWVKSHLKLNLHINLAESLLNDLSAVSEITDKIQRFAVQPEKICIEIAAELFIAESKKIIESLQTLRGAGFNLTMDNFKVENLQISPRYLSHFNSVKINMFLIKELQDKPDVRQQVLSTIEHAHTMSQQVIALGVEDENTLALLQDMGCDAAQGYFFSKPLALNNFNKWFSVYL